MKLLARLRTADDILARAEADNRGVAIVPLGEASRDISLQPPAAARVRIKQLKPLPHAVERTDDGGFRVSGDDPCVVDMPTMWAHDITNVGRGDLLTMFWSNDIFNPREPDTFQELVAP